MPGKGLYANIAAKKAKVHPLQKILKEQNKQQGHNG